MPLRQSPSFKPVNDKVLEVTSPAILGINLKDLEYEQDVTQTPYMLNMMYRNGAFSKRYGQDIFKSYSDTIYAGIIYRDSLIVHSGTKVYKGDTEIATGMPEKKGLFILFNQMLYYINTNIYQYDGTTWSAITPYIPTVAINMHPDGTNVYASESYNMVGTGFENHFHGDGTSTEYHLTDTDLSQVVPKVRIDNGSGFEEWTYDTSLSSAKTFKVDYTTGVVTLKSAASEGTNNVFITAYKSDQEWQDYNNQILNSKFYACFGGDNNSRLFLAGGGKSTYYYSDVYDATYFPYVNYAKVGNSADDITGFGEQYNCLFVFKPTEIYSLNYYVQDQEAQEDTQVIGAFTSQLVNASIGCDCPFSIQLIDNQLTWFSTRDGVCTLVSTNIIDERNVRTISRNIDKTNNFGVEGILDIDLTGIKESVVSVDYDNKYFLCFPKRNENGSSVDYGKCFVWDYGTTPFYVSSNKISAARDLGWFLFDHIYTKQFIIFNNTLYYFTGKSGFTSKMIELNDSFADVNFDDDPTSENYDHYKPIEAYYMTPFLQFNAVEYLKNIKNLYIQCRGDTASRIEVYYYTDESSLPTRESEDIVIGGKIWHQFDWSTFEWNIVNWAITMRRKCSLKKIQMASFFFKNNELNRDMSITHIGLQYQIVKYVK